MPTEAFVGEFDSFADDLMAERTVRPLIIVGASKVDYLLLEILVAHLLPKLSKHNEKDELLEGDRPLSTFSARIKTCFRLGLIDEKFYLALEKLRALRNPSAHHVTFDATRSPTREHVADFNNMFIHRRSFKLTRDRYFDTFPVSPLDVLRCSILTMCVLLEAIRDQVNRVSENRKTVGISKR